MLTRADRLVFDHVRFLGNQDTLYLNSSAAAVVARAYLRDCYVEGDVDFIFGRGDRRLRRAARSARWTAGSTTNNGYVTAPSTMIDNPYGFLFTRRPLHQRRPRRHRLPRPAVAPEQRPERDRAGARSATRGSGSTSARSPWTDFSGGWSWRDARFAEYHNRGPGAAGHRRPPAADPGRRPTAFTVRAYLSGADGWSPQTRRR